MIGWRSPPYMSPSMLDWESLKNAHERIRSCEICRNTPVLTSTAMDRHISQKVGRPISLFFKCEHLQIVGSFKIRGALNFALSMPEAVRSKGLVAHSSGNHGAAVACVGRYLNIPVVVVAPSDAPVSKIRLIESYGAVVERCEPTLESRKQTCLRIATKLEMTEVPPFDHESIIAGQGTQAIEILEALPHTDAIVAAVGGGGMISGIISAAKHMSPRIKVFGAEPTNADSVSASLIAGQRRGPSKPEEITICDALRVSPPGARCWEVLSTSCDGIFLVDDASIREAMKCILFDLKQLVEPSGACAVAAVFSDEFILRLIESADISRIVVILCGGNVDPGVFKDLVFPSIDPIPQ